MCIRDRYRWTCIWVCAGILIGIVLVMIFCCSEKLNIGSSLLWSFAYLVMGGLLGFIFSVPKIISDSHVPSPQAGAAEMAIAKNRIEENTNLTQVSDWLTKVLIGAGLVQLKEIPKFILYLSKVMAQGIRSSSVVLNTVDSATIMLSLIHI